MTTKKPILQTVAYIMDLTCLILSISVMVLVGINVDEVSILKKSSHTEEVFQKILWAMISAIVIGYLSFLISLLLNLYSLAIIAPKMLVNCLNLNGLQTKIYKEIKGNKSNEMVQTEDV